MTNLEMTIQNYLEFCSFQKRLDKKTLKAYRIDLMQFYSYCNNLTITEITPTFLEKYIGTLHTKYKPKTVKRKIASLKAFFHYLEYREIIQSNPFNKLQIHFREPIILPKTIPLNTIELLLKTVYSQKKSAKTVYQRRNALRDVAIFELLFATGIRISELCNLSPADINMYDGTILIYGKGSKERRLQIGNSDVLEILNEYFIEFQDEISKCNKFFVNQLGHSLSDQAVRRLIRKYSKLAGINLHITPHMFRHTFATALLEADVDIRYIQEMLGHSSINITEIYTHVALAKQRDILTTKHPRKNMRLE